MNSDIVFSGELIGGLFSVVFACLMLPVIYIIYYTVKKKINLISLLSGVLGFMLFGYFISGTLIGTFAPSASAQEGAVKYALLCGICTGIAEGGGAFFAMWLLRKKFDELSTPISYALGYCIIDTMLVKGANAFVRLAEAYTVSTKGLDTVLASVQGDAVEELRQELAQLASTPAQTYFLSAVEAVSLFVLFVALCRIVWYGVHFDGKKMTYYVVGVVLLKAASEFPTAFYQAGGTENYLTCEIISYVVTLVSVGIAVLLSLRYDDKEQISAGPLNRKLL